MGNLFSKPKTPKMPDAAEASSRPQRMPVETDQSIREHALRRREMFRKRQGRLSTILSDTLSGGMTLG